MGTIEKGRRGCACPENILLREVLSHLLLHEDEYVVVDMEAGLEHLGRGTAEGVDRMLVIVEPGWASLQTAARIAGLAQDLGLKGTAAVANKIRDDQDLIFIRENLKGMPLLEALPYEPIIMHHGSHHQDLGPAKKGGGLFEEKIRRLSEFIEAEGRTPPPRSA
jgi:CO dehydrogenase maturation factor